MSRRTRAQRQRAGTPRPAPAPRGREKSPAFDPMVPYRSLATPPLWMRSVLIAGLGLSIAAQIVAISSAKAVDTASGLALGGMLAILLFLGGGFIRHQRALFRIRREHPGAWPASIRFALATMPIPLGFGGRPADDRERRLRRLTLLLLLVFAITAIAGSSHH